MALQDRTQQQPTEPLKLRRCSISRASGIEQPVKVKDKCVIVQHKQITLWIVSMKHQYTIVKLSRNSLKNRAARFYADSGADITLVKQKCFTDNSIIDSEQIVEISGVTAGTSVSLGCATINLQGINCKVHIAPDNFPVDTDGVLEWKVFEDYSGKINATNKCLEFNELMIPFKEGECFIIPHVNEK